MTIQGVFGLIPNIYGKGAAAKQVYELMVRMRREMGGNEPQVSVSAWTGEQQLDSDVMYSLL